MFDFSDYYNEQYEEYLREEEEHLREKADFSNSIIQEINDYLGLERFEINSNLKTRIPSGQIRKVEHFKNQLNFIKDEQLKTNLSYHLQYYDFNLWVINRTTVSYSVKSLLIKFHIANICSIIESVIINLYGRKGKTFVKRIETIVEFENFSPEIGFKLIDLWKKRDSLHVYEAVGKEINNFSLGDFFNASSILREFIEYLKSTPNSNYN